MSKTLTEETRTLITTIKHQKIVSFLLRELARQLEQRADMHDVSKWSIDEFAGFVEINRIARTHPYGSQEYKNSIKNNPAVKWHFSRNRHHPEFHPDGVNMMSFVDIVEMTCDWVGASATYGTTDIEKVIETQKERFGLSDSQLYLIELLIEVLHDTPIH